MNEYITKIIDFYMDTFEKEVSKEEREQFLLDSYGFSNEEVFISRLINNFIMVQSEIMQDLKEINDRVKQIDALRSKLNPEDYEFRKLDNCKRINTKAKEEIEQFLAEKAIAYVKERVVKKEDWIRKTDALGSLFDRLPYSYSYHKQFYDYNYDFSTDTKYRFLSFHSLTKIQEKIDLKATSLEGYYADLDFIMTHDNMLDKVLVGVKSHHVIAKREEIFDTLKELYKTERYQSFINLAVLQVEGLFYDFCYILNDETEVQSVGTLTVKAEKAFAIHQALWLAIYPYYAYDAPVFRNKIAHHGIWDSQDLKNFCNELVFDLYSILQAIKTSNKLPYNLLGVVLMLREDVKTVAIPEEKYSSVLANLFSGSQLSKFGATEIFNILKKREEKKTILEFYKIIVNDTEETNLYEECCRLSEVIYSEKFWDLILELIKDVREHNPGKPYDAIDFVKAIKNSYIVEFTNGSVLKEKCIEVSKELKRFENNKEL